MNYLDLATWAFGAAVSWMANLGVVPLFLLAAFLFAPIALCFALRRFSVTAVLEAIDISSRNKTHLAILKLLNITKGRFFVKGFFLAHIALSFPAQATISTGALSDVVLAKGEQRELGFEGIKKFSVGNSDIISYKLNAKSSKLLIKGKKVGFTDLIIWNKKGKETISIYVLSREKFLKTFQIAEALKNLNLTIDIKGPIMTATGVISDFSDYLYLQKIKRQYENQVFLRINLDPKLRNHIIGQIYKKLFANGHSNVSCQVDWLEIICFYEGSSKSEFLKQLAAYYQVSFIQQNSRLLQKNFRLKFKLIQLERMDGREIHLGLDKLQSNLMDFFENGIRNLVEQNSLFLQKYQMDLSSLAEPEMIINLDTPQLIEIGTQIPFQNISTQNTNIIAPIEWRFAGLKIKTKITESQGRPFLKFHTEFTRPSEQGIGGSKEVSSVLLDVGVPIKIFQIGLQTISKDRKGIPFISDVPILKHLFESKSDQKTYKQIYGYVILEAVE
jgi:hypothetical protein